MPHQRSPAHIAWIFAATLALFDACSFDEAKLRGRAARDAAAATDAVATSADTARTGDHDVATREVGADTATDMPAGFTEVNGPGLPDGSAAGGAGGGLGGAGGSGVDGSSGADGAANRLPDGDGQGSGEETGSPGLVDTASPVDDGAAAWVDLGEDAADVPAIEDSGADDRGGQSTDVLAGADDASMGAGDGRAASDDTMSVDARGKKTCPTTISGSLDRSDSTQIGRLSRTDSASTCGVLKGFPGNGADRTYSHLYDVYHFINVASAPACFTFTLTYSNFEQLHVAAYSAFDPTDITGGYLGDVGDTLAPPQTMGITVGPGETITVVVYAVAIGTDPAGPYNLACNVQ